ncbi:purine nucleosidase [Streptomyces sp. LBL]|uniref:nucleoside hydrolase n=1 Tax=Streptomyces sp. LBL TaxID=2940562 RepID=UPI0024769F99|nr:nucleoside hydrolase [Streptomyces sp. LBL]MDH6624525.1 purine nucleosidase [Streptomyces sp. LBL]
MFVPPAGPRTRVIMDNDYAGDPDGLYQLVHHLLSPSVDIRGVIGSRHGKSMPAPDEHHARDACRRVTEVLELMQLTGKVPVFQGANQPMKDTTTPQETAGAEALIAEAMRTDTTSPLYVALGGPLTQLASAYLMEPRIADRLTAVWIGGPEYFGTAAPMESQGPEYNIGIDINAAKVIFNDSPIPLWQVPRDAYFQALVGMTELVVHVKPKGPIGAYLFARLNDAHELFAEKGGNLGEVYVLGDNPMVLLTALQMPFDLSASSSSSHQMVNAPRINDDGSYTHGKNGRMIRVYTQLDVRLMVHDFYAKLEAHHTG